MTNTDKTVTRPIIGIENRTAQEVFDIMCDRFRAASITPPAPERSKEEVGVKPLVWKRGWGKHSCKTIVGTYTVISRAADGAVDVRLDNGQIIDWNTWASDMENGEAAAQADYEQRIKSALEPASLHKGEVEHEAIYNGEGYSFTGQSRAPSPAPLPVTITDEMVERATSSFLASCHIRSIDMAWMRAALTAALSKPGEQE